MLSEEQIDDKIDEWHAGDTGVPLHEYLGMTHEEYKHFLENTTQSLKDEMDDLSQKAFLSLGPEGMKLDLKEYEAESSNLVEWERLSKETMVDDLYED